MIGSRILIVGSLNIDMILKITKRDCHVAEDAPCNDGAGKKIQIPLIPLC